MPAGPVSYCFPSSLSRFAGSTENNKINNLSGLCGSNEQSEPRFMRDKCAVSYCIKTEAISNRSRMKITIFYMISYGYKIIKNLNRTEVTAIN